MKVTAADWRDPLSSKKGAFGLTDNERTLILNVAKNIRQANAFDATPMYALVETLIQKHTIRLETILELLTDPEKGEGAGWRTYPE